MSQYIQLPLPPQQLQTLGEASGIAKRMEAENDKRMTEQRSGQAIRKALEHTNVLNVNVKTFPFHSNTFSDSTVG